MIMRFGFHPVPESQLPKLLEFPVLRAVKVSFVSLLDDFWKAPKDRGWSSGDPIM